MRYEEQCYWNTRTYEKNYWKKLNKKTVVAILIIIIALPIGTAWIGIPPIFKGTIKAIETAGYWMGWKLQ